MVVGPSLFFALVSLILTDYHLEQVLDLCNARRIHYMGTILFLRQLGIVLRLCRFPYLFSFREFGFSLDSGLLGFTKDLYCTDELPLI